MKSTKDDDPYSTEWSFGLGNKNEGEEMLLWEEDVKRDQFCVKRNIYFMRRQLGFYMQNSSNNIS